MDRAAWEAPTARRLRPGSRGDELPVAGQKAGLRFFLETSPFFGRWTGCSVPASCDGPPPPSTTWENVGAGARRTTVTGLQKTFFDFSLTPLKRGSSRGQPTYIDKRAFVSGHEASRIF